MGRLVKYFAGTRPIDDESWDFVLGPTEIENLINAAYILSPGLTASSIIAEKIVEFLEEKGLKLEPKENFSPTREDIVSLENIELSKLEDLLNEDPKYGNIICRCNNVSEAEIVEAIRRGARTVESIKFRTNAGKGPCQGSRCLAKIIAILMRELKTEEILLGRKGSKIFM